LSVYPPIFTEADGSAFRIAATLAISGRPARRMGGQRVGPVRYPIAQRSTRIRQHERLNDVAEPDGVLQRLNRSCCAAVTSVRLSGDSTVAVDPVPASLIPIVRRFSWRLRIGLLLEAWPRWAAGALLAAGCAALACRLFVPAADPYLYWLLAAPALAILPTALISIRRAYTPAEVLAIVDALSGGGGSVLTLAERHDQAWSHASQIGRAAHLSLPRFRPWRKLAVVVPALAFLLIVLLLPQRTSASDAASMADDVVDGLAATLAALQSHDLVTPEEEKQLQEEIERVRNAARERMDASAWEAADAVRERMASNAAAKRDAASWAQEALARYSAAGGLDGNPDAASAKAELSRALEALARSGALAGAPSEIQQMLASGATLPADAAALARLAASLSEYLGGVQGALGELRGFGGRASRFDPSEFAAAGEGEGDGSAGDTPGRGAATRGRADAEMTYGRESLPAERFKAQALPPGYVRSPDDWAPIVSLPGAPNVAPEAGGRAAARAYAEDAGQAAWRRTLAPRHQSAVKKYFQP
jgi:hypothetical protein